MFSKYLHELESVKVLYTYSNTFLVGAFISSVVCPSNLGIKSLSYKGSSVNNSESDEVDIEISSCEVAKSDFLPMCLFLCIVCG